MINNVGCTYLKSFTSKLSYNPKIKSPTSKLIFGVKTDD